MQNSPANEALHGKIQVVVVIHQPRRELEDEAVRKKQQPMWLPAPKCKCIHVCANDHEWALKQLRTAKKSGEKTGPPGTQAWPSTLTRERTFKFRSVKLQTRPPCENVVGGG